MLVLRRLHRIRRKHRSGVKKRSHRKVTRIVLAVITAYFICWVPYWFLQIFITIDPLIQSLGWKFLELSEKSPMRFLKELSHLTTIIGYANNCLNPLLYVFLSESFREEYLTLMKCFRNGHCSAPQYPLENDQPDGIQFMQYRQSAKSTLKSKEAICNIKHSVVLDELPSRNRRTSHGCNHIENNEEHVSPQSKSYGQFFEETINSFPRSEVLLLKNNKRKSINDSSRKQFTTDLTNRPMLMMDDGGVYCGNYKD